MRILWASNSPFEKTGYGQQTALTGTRLAEHHGLAFFANYSTKPNPTFSGTPVYRPPSQAPRDEFLYGLADAALDFQAELVVFLGDPWAQKPTAFSQLKAQGFPIALWYPCDSEPLPYGDYPVLNLVDYIIPMSFHGLRQLERAGFEPQNVIPHALDLELWHPRASDPDRVVNSVGMVQANFGTRKLIALQLEAFSLACEALPDRELKLLAHVDLFGKESGVRGQDYSGLLDYFNIQDRVYTSDDTDEPADMPRLFSSFDVLLHTTAGEGFGVPIIEAFSCGVPAIVTDNSAMADFGKSAIKVKPAFKEFVGPKQTFYSWPKVEDVASAIVAFYEGEVKIETEAALEEARKFDIESTIPKLWLPFINKVTEDHYA